VRRRSSNNTQPDDQQHHQQPGHEATETSGDVTTQSRDDDVTADRQSAAQLGYEVRV